MLPLRFPWVWLILGWLMVAAVCVGSLLPGSSLPVVRIEDKLLHAGSYFLLMLWFAGVYEKRRHMVLALVLVLLGLSLDVIQGGLSSRSFELLDVLANTIGIAVAWGLSSWLLGGWCLRVERLLLA